MSKVYDIKKLHHGEQSLAGEVLKVLPLIEKHFKPFDGQRAAIQSGRSAAFRKACKAFVDECAALSNMRVIVDDSSGLSVWLKFDINEKDKDLPGGGYCVNYFKMNVYLGQIDTGNWQTAATNELKYQFEPDVLKTRCQRVRNITIEALEKVKAEAKQKRDELEALEDSVPSPFKGIFD